MISPTIYWLVDTRPETIAAGYPNGRPVHVGSSTHDNSQSIVAQIKDAERYARPWQVILILKSLGGHFRVDIVNSRQSNEWLRAMFPPQARWVSKRRKRFEANMAASDIELIGRYIPVTS